MGKRKGSWLEAYVENRYRRAGFETKRHVFTNQGEIDILAVKGKTRLAIEIKSGNQIVTSSIIEALYKKAQAIKAMPVLVIGPKVQVTTDAMKTAKKLGVRIRKIKRS